METVMGGLTTRRGPDNSDTVAGAFEQALLATLGPQIYGCNTDDPLAQALWAALVNTCWTHPTQGPAGVSYSFRAAGDLVAALRCAGDYLDWYCCRSDYGTVDPAIETVLVKHLGWSHTRL